MYRFSCAIALIAWLCLFTGPAFANHEPWYVKAAENGDAEAQKSVADDYYYGRGAAKDYAEAAKWYKMAAKPGSMYDDWDVRTKLCNIYQAGGFGVEKDISEAAFWARVASQDNHTQHVADVLTAMLPPDQQAKVAERAREFLKPDDPAHDICIDHRQTHQEWYNCIYTQEKLDLVKKNAVKRDAAAAAAAAPVIPPLPFPALAEGPNIVPLAAPEYISMRGFSLEEAARFAVTARVHNIESFQGYLRPEAPVQIATYGLAIGWDRMGAASTLTAFQFVQSGRGYTYTWTGAPPVAEDVIKAENAHVLLIPANTDIASQISHLTRGQLVSLSGHLVHIHDPDRLYWKTALNKQDQDTGYCFYLYVEALAVPAE